MAKKNHNYLRITMFVLWEALMIGVVINGVKQACPIGSIIMGMLWFSVLMFGVYIGFKNGNDNNQ